MNGNSTFHDTLNVVVTGIESETARLPQKYQLYQNYPNPFNPTTQITYDLPVDGERTITIYNVHGTWIRMLLAGRYQAGSGFVMWDGNDTKGEAVPSGLYFYGMTSSGFDKTLKMALVK
ncbi:T9SS type A sorting domain-containing protein [candidate division KSB1 bacterium]|nr:T9SS type A sorting domain-containing protein [candidate division KSB1 bacterium]